MEEGDTRLRQQFQVLQEQQQKKLMRMKQRQEEKANKKEGAGKSPRGGADASEVINGFGVDDNLGLKLSDPVTKNSMFQEHINEQLSEQIRELKDETGRLYKLLSERDYEIRKLKKQREQDRLAIGGGGVANETAATKIVELSKKSRELTAELEGEKTKNRQLMRKVRDLEREMSQGNHSAKARPPSPSEEKMAALQTELKSTSDKLGQANARLGEYRTQIASLKQEVKVYGKVLSSEVGDNVNVQSLLNQPSGWKGRAQQVLLLQKKVDRLKAQLSQSQSQSLRPDTELSLEDQFMTMGVTDDALDLSSLMTPSATRSSKPSIDDKQRSRVRQMEKERREAKEKASNDLKALEEDYARLKGKLDASKARNKVLSEEIKGLKQQVTRCMDKGKHDDELIEALLKQQSQLKASLEELNARNQHVSAQQSRDARDLTMQAQREANAMEQLRIIVAEKERKVRVLEEEIMEMRRQKQQINGLDRPPSQQGFTLNPAATPVGRPPSSGGFVLNPDARPDSKPPSSSGRRSQTTPMSPAPPPPSSRQGARTSSQLSNRSGSRQSVGDADLPPRGSPLRSVRPASTGSISSYSQEAIDSLRLQCQELKSLNQAAEVERDRLLELVSVLQKRLDESSTKVVDSQNSLHELKQKNVFLEKQLGRAKMDSGKGGKAVTAVISNKTSVGLLGVEELLKEGLPITLDSIDALQQRLAIQVDENDALKAALQSTLKAKEEDLRLYHQMMDQTKTVFLQGLRQFRQGSAASSQPGS
ncbi:coiled-coil domain-containing protein 13-like [Diadema setosum]|uniref:coiled-coil domain-containing protein 13-like n=1 Tax=Diadema setosum TaxID=31175 RepID=UPI003B3BA8C6